MLLSLVDALGTPEMHGVTQRLREEAAGESLLSLERLVRQPPPSRALPDSEASEPRVPEYVKGRTLTLGERKSLARRPDRAAIDRLLRDPHPVVIRRLLENPRVTEDDVVRLAARRPGQPEVLAEIARTPAWLHRARVRLALILNPDATPAECGRAARGPPRPPRELHLVAEAACVTPHVRALCASSSLERRPPVEQRELRGVGGAVAEGARPGACEERPWSAHVVARMRISPEVEIALSLAATEAARRRHEYMTVEHLLYALLFDEATAKVVRHAGGDVKALKGAGWSGSSTSSLRDAASRGARPPLPPRWASSGPSVGPPPTCSPRGRKR